MIRVLVTGADGQLGKCLNTLQENYKNLEFVFTNRTTLDISVKSEVDEFFLSNNFDWCINCAAYTNVDKAESDLENAKSINETAVKNLAEASFKHKTKIIHISTDFVFDGAQSKAYKEDAPTNPLGVYGSTKLTGEEELKKANPNHFMIRTSWLYSEFNQNFLKTMLRLAANRDQISVVSDQIGTPTYARDLAEVILQIINQDNKAFGLYHYSNEGVASWYDFAKAIFDINNSAVKVIPIDTKSYPTPAKRPPFSVLDKTKIKETFNLTIPYWRDSLKVAISNL